MVLKNAEGSKRDASVENFESNSIKQDLTEDSEGCGSIEGKKRFDRGDGGVSFDENEDESVSRSNQEQKNKLGHRRVGMGGEVTYKKIQSCQLMGSIQLGIEHSVGGLASKPERDVLMHDFMIVETTTFVSQGSNSTPAHHFLDFIFKTYAPSAFRYFRDLFGIQSDDFLSSICSAPLRELSNPGASGSIFYLTFDDEFIIKTVQHKEGEFLQKLLPGYFMNLNQNPRTLLPKFFGLFCYQCNAKNIRIIAMNNLLPSSITIHQKYDLKGSTYKRQASKEERQKKSPTYKDLDFMEHHPEGILLRAETYTALIKTIQRDCRVLESFKIMDYSFLVGIHNLDEAARDLTESPTAYSQQSTGEGSEILNHSKNEAPQENTSINLNRSQSINRQRLVAHSTAMESIQAEIDPIYEEENLPPGGIPARNSKGDRLLLFVGIIDILQSYGLKKKLEHAWKSILHDGDTVSVHRPGFYAERFQSFMANTVFKKVPSTIKRSLSKRKSMLRIRNPENNEDLAVGSISKPRGSSSFSSSTPSQSRFSPLISRKTKKNQEEAVKFRDLAYNDIMYQEDSISVSALRFESYTEIKSSLSVGSGSSTSGVGSGWRLAWTRPPSVAGSTLTWTEGTPSFTESSCSEDNDCLPIPVQGLHQHRKSSTSVNIPICM